MTNYTETFRTGAYSGTDTQTSPNPKGKIYCTTSCSLISLSKFSTSNATRAIIYDSSQTILDTATFVGDTATFSTPYSLTAGVYYYVGADNAGASYTRGYWVPVGGFPVNCNNINLTTSTDANNVDAIVSAVTYIEYIPPTYTIKQAMLKTNYPITDGIIAETTTQTGHVMQLEPEFSLVADKYKKGL